MTMSKLIDLGCVSEETKAEKLRVNVLSDGGTVKCDTETFPAAEKNSGGIPY
jgi:hypothetical protein